MVVPHLEILRIHAKIVTNEQPVMSLIHIMVISIVFFLMYHYYTLYTLYHQLNMILLKKK
jgi:hypothetical protein